jgi:malate dehydrogenase (oxaloacetate-decarboxylating)(NADP+)
MIKEGEALEYHKKGRPGKVAIVATKPFETQKDLALAYSPGVAEPCIEIYKDKQTVYDYTAKSNLVAVISNGSAVLGLGDIGPEASKPVMEGKGILFKKFADIDVFDLELDSNDPEEIIKTVKMLEPTFGGINLEDFKAPECFRIEEALREQMSIPVFHDDQHGTAIISSAALLNALELQKKKISEIKIVINGAGSAGIAIAKLYHKLGAKKKNIRLLDSNGVIYKGREKGINSYKAEFAVETKERSLADAMKNADVFSGVSVAGVLTKEMVASMAKNPIIFAMANPDPEITYPDAISVRDDLIMATGRSDYPNQVNNVLCFPYIFRGALDVRAKAINDEMKIAAVKALATLAKEDVPDSVLLAYGKKSLKFSKEYIIPKPFDQRAMLWVSKAVAKAAMESGVAQKPIKDFEQYTLELMQRFGIAESLKQKMINRAKLNKKRIVFPEGEHPKILRAANILKEEGIADPILIGRFEKIAKRAEELGLDINQFNVITPKKSEKLQDYANTYYQYRQRKGSNIEDAIWKLGNYNAWGAMMVLKGDADGFISGVSSNYSEVLRPALKVLKDPKEIGIIAGLYIIATEKDLVFFADTTVNINPSSEELAEIAILAADAAKTYDVEPKVAMLSFSNFGGSKHPLADKVKKATEIVKLKRPDIAIDGEMQADTALNEKKLNGLYEFNSLKEKANVLIFPSLEAGNIAYKMMHHLAGADIIGPVLLGMKAPIHVLDRDCEVDDIVSMTAVATVEAQQMS